MHLITTLAFACLPALNSASDLSVCDATKQAYKDLQCCGGQAKSVCVSPTVGDEKQPVQYEDSINDYNHWNMGAVKHTVDGVYHASAGIAPTSATLEWSKLYDTEYLTQKWERSDRFDHEENAAYVQFRPHRNGTGGFWIRGGDGTTFKIDGDTGETLAKETSESSSNRWAVHIEEGDYIWTTNSDNSAMFNLQDQMDYTGGDGRVVKGRSGNWIYKVRKSDLKMVARREVSCDLGLFESAEGFKACGEVSDYSDPEQVEHYIHHAQTMQMGNGILGSAKISDDDRCASGTRLFIGVGGFPYATAFSQEPQNRVLGLHDFHHHGKLAAFCSDTLLPAWTAPMRSAYANPTNEAWDSLHWLKHGGVTETRDTLVGDLITPDFVRTVEDQGGVGTGSLGAGALSPLACTVTNDDLTRYLPRDFSVSVSDASSIAVGDVLTESVSGALLKVTESDGATQIVAKPYLATHNGWNKGSTFTKSDGTSVSVTSVDSIRMETCFPTKITPGFGYVGGKLKHNVFTDCTTWSIPVEAGTLGTQDIQHLAVPEPLADGASFAVGDIAHGFSGTLDSEILNPAVGSFSGLTFKGDFGAISGSTAGDWEANPSPLATFAALNKDWIGHELETAGRFDALEEIGDSFEYGLVLSHAGDGTDVCLQVREELLSTDGTVISLSIAAQTVACTTPCDYPADISAMSSRESPSTGSAPWVQADVPAPSFKNILRLGDPIASADERVALGNFGGSLWFRVANDGETVCWPSGNGAGESLDKYLQTIDHTLECVENDYRVDTALGAYLDDTDGGDKDAELIEYNAALQEREDLSKAKAVFRAGLSASDKAAASCAVFCGSTRTGKVTSVTELTGPDSWLSTNSGPNAGAISNYHFDADNYNAVASALGQYSYVDMDANNVLMIPGHDGLATHVVATTKGGAVGTIALASDGTATLSQLRGVGQQSPTATGGTASSNFGGLCYVGAGDIVAIRTSEPSGRDHGTFFSFDDKDDVHIDSGEGAVVGYNYKTGDVEWVTKMATNHARGIQCGRGLVFALEASTGDVKAINAADGTHVFSVPTDCGTYGGYNCAGIMISGDSLLVSTETSLLKYRLA